MKKITISILVSLSSIASLFAQENSLLWEISKENYHTSYLFGTVHLSDDRVFNFSDSLLPLLYSCDAYAGEIILQPEDMLSLLPYFFEKDQAKQCKNVLSEEEYALVSKALTEKLGEEMLFILPVMSPYVASIIISIPNEYTEDNKYFLDMYLQEQADSLHKKLISLESIESQFAYIQGIEIEKQKAHLLKIASNQEANNNDIEALLKEYLNANLSAIEEMLSLGEDEDPIMTPSFMMERNEIQAKGIMMAMLEQSTFIGVGAAHLPGETGLLKILKDAGFSLRPIY